MAVNLSPVGGVAAQFFNNDGVPLAGGLIYTYTAGSSTPQATYTTSAGGIAHSNPIVLDSAGRVPTGEIWLTDGISYKFVLKDSAGTLLATYDNIVGINSNFINYTGSQEIQTATAGQTVFTLATMAYQPGTNSLTVFVDGVNQYGPGAQYAYTETSGTVVTFASGLHVGASVKFTTTAINSASYGDAFQISYTPPFTGSEATNVGAKLAQTVSVKDFGATGDGSTDDYDAIQTAFNYCVANGYSLYFPAGTYNVVDKNYPFGQGLPVTALKDCNNVTVYGDGPTSILQTTSSAGADVLQLNGVKNLHFRNLKVTAFLTGFADAGSNGISVTNGWDNITVHDVWIEDCPYLDKGNYPDGGKGLTIQPGTPTVECGSLSARIFVKNCVIGTDLEWDLLNAATKKPAIMIDAQIEKALIGVLFQDAGGSNTGLDESFSLNYMVRAQTVNCQRDAIVGRGFGMDWNINVVANQNAAALRLNPNGDPWASWDDVVDSFRCTFAKNSRFYIHGYKPDQDVKAAIGDTSNTGFDGSTQNCQILIDIGGAAIDPITVPHISSNYVQDCVIQFTTKTCTSAEIPDILYYPTLNNTIIYGAYHHFNGMQITNAVNFSYDNGIQTFNSLERDGLTMYFKQTGGTGGDLIPLGVKSYTGTKVFGIRQDGAIATAGASSATSVSGVTKKIGIYDLSGTFLGYVPVYTTAA